MSDDKKKENTEEITLELDEEKMRAIKIYGKDKIISVIPMKKSNRQATSKGFLQRLSLSDLIWLSLL